MKLLLNQLQTRKSGKTDQWKGGWKYLSADLMVILLFPVFFVLHGSNRYSGLIPAETLFILFFRYALLVAVFYIAAVVIMRERSRAFLFALLLVIFYFFFGSVHDLLKNLPVNTRFASWSVFLPAWLLLAATGFFIILRSKRPPVRVAQFSRILLLLVLSIEIFAFLTGLTAGKAGKNDLAGQFPVERNLQPSGLPDIYYIVFDEHGSTKSLHEEFDFDNSLLDSTLRKYGFYVAGNARSNYNFTPFSVASTLAMGYLDLQQADSALDMQLMLQGIHTARENKLVKFLEQQGYSIINYGFFDFPAARSRGEAFFGRPFFEDIIANPTLYYRYSRDIRWLVEGHSWLGGNEGVPAYFNRNRKKHIARHNRFFSGLEEELSKENNRPRFVYAHFLLPHQPFYQDRHGNEIPGTAIIRGNRDREQGYLEQVAYVSMMIRKLLPAMVAKGSRERVVIIQGDHGYRLFSPEVPREKVFSNLQAIYYSGQDYRGMYDSISNVNIFRVVMNRFFDQRLPLLPDSSFYFLDPDVEGRR